MPPVYDTTLLPLDFGIHVHARKEPDGIKVIDCTYRAVKLIGDRLPVEGLLVSEIDAVYYMVSSVFGFQVHHVRCSLCGYSHLDKDWFSVHPHRRHLCAGCGKNFRDNITSIGNPIRAVQEILNFKSRNPIQIKRSLAIQQRDYPGGIQIWGSNPAIVWSSRSAEEEGIHVHAYKQDGGNADIDDTFSTVVIDGLELNPLMVRTLMAQKSLPHLEGRVVSLKCTDCGSMEFGTGEKAFTPTTANFCSKCGGQLIGPSRLRRTIGNPLIAVLDRLSKIAPRSPQNHKTGLRPETS